MYNPLAFCIEQSKFAPYKHTVNGTISNAIATYLERKIPLQKLLYDFNAISSTPGLLDELFNNWRYFCEKQNIPYVCGVSEEEARFNLEAMSLHKQKPINVIKSIYYRNIHLNDSGIERVFLDSISNHFSSNNSILVVNPSPIAIEQTESITSSALYAVPDKVLSSLYSKQIKCSRFMDMNEALNINSDIDSIVVFTSPSDEELLDKIMRILSSVDSKNVFAIMQTRLIDNKKSSLWGAISHRNYRICDIVIVPNELTNTSPKKKCFLSMTSVDTPNTQIHKIEYDPQSKLISLSSKEINESWEAVRDSKLTINKIMDTNSVISSSAEKDPVYSKAQLFAFTNEIQISYTFYSNKDKTYAKAYYAETKNPVIPSIRGKSLTKRKERYLTDTSEEALSTILEEIPYIDSFTQTISQDILENYLNVGIPVSLKTLWFVCRKELSRNTAYNDEILREVFSNKSDLCTINVDSTSTSQIEICVHKLFSEGEEAKELSFLKQLNLLVNTAIKNGYISNNHILPLIPAASNKASKRQAEARQALAKRSFESIEENRIVKYLKSRCIEISLYLAVIIRLFTGISVKEVCGLTWSDFLYNPNIGVYYLSITKSIGINGKPISHALEENWDRYRILPLARFLSDIILERKKYLIRQGIDEKTLLDYPIVLNRESTSSMLKGHRISYCKPSAVYQKCREAIEKANIPPHIIFLPNEGCEMETDINSYNGDIFRSNFRDKALNSALLEIDELHYYLGITKPDTYSKHYCDYTNEYVQLIISNKLNRWGSLYSTKTNTNTTQKSNAIVSSGINDGLPCVEFTIVNDPSVSNSTTIEIESAHGFKIITNPVIDGDAK